MISGIIAIGPFPPPVHGASNVMLQATELLKAADFRIIRCDVGARLGSKGVSYHAQRAVAYTRSLIRLMTHPRYSVVYLALSGGSGLIYDLAVVALAKLAGKSIVFHHHSFAYISRRSNLLRAIVWISPKDHLHIVLCSRMERGLRAQYGEHLPCCLISNLAFFDSEQEQRRDVGRSFSVIGYLSNISFEKGIDRFFDFMAELRRRGSKVTGRIAGPFLNADVRKYVETRILDIGGLECVGPVYGASKNDFLRSIDLLFFPTRYSNEAQPLVIYDAQLASVLTASTDRGCVSEMIFASAGLLLDPHANDVDRLVEKALLWERDEDSFLAAKCMTKIIRERLLSRARCDREKFLQIFAEEKHKTSSKALGGGHA
jgi:glycosyltransferase involved in cell wall biosynthesis